MTVPDKKGVRPSDLITWTETIHPTIVTPLQDTLFKLQQSNAALDEHTQSLIKQTRALNVPMDTLEVQAADQEQEFLVTRAYREDLLTCIERAKVTTQRLQMETLAQDPKLERLQKEIERSRTNQNEELQDVLRCQQQTQAIENEIAHVKQSHEAQLERLEETRYRLAVKCEVLDLVRRFADNEAVQLQSLRAIHRLCQTPRKLELSNPLFP